MNFLTVQYWVSYYPEAFQPLAAKIVFSWFVLALVAGLLLRHLATRQKDRFVRKLKFRVYYLLVTYAVIGMFFFLATQQLVPIFGARIWFAILDLVAIVWLVIIVKNYKKTVPELRQKAKERKEFEKYIPK